MHMSPRALDCQLLQVTAFYTPHPPLARQQFEERLDKVRHQLYGPGAVLIACFLALPFCLLVGALAAEPELNIGCMVQG